MFNMVLIMSKYFKVTLEQIKEPTTAAEARAAIYEALNLTDIGESAACELADKFKEEFSTGDYCSGRTYYPAGTEQKGGWGSLDNYYGEFDEEGYNTEGFWVSSSDQC
ncbi:hypothetical protein NCTGTJJY_CDS0133 [Serratia phage 92A1]|nr:hypothetical protein NCTGTJJY_CDS0133 [Serratia phage 92A1]